MLPSTNKTISILQLSGTLTREWTEVETGIPAYINQTREDIVGTYDNQPSLLTFRMFTNGDHTTVIAVGDRISDGTNTYEVTTPAAISEDLTGLHHQYLLTLQQT